jgi:uncharacterized HAD superfamily protein
VGTLVTSRLERYRGITEEWLKANEIEYGRLVMLDLDTAEERRRLKAHAPFKARVFLDVGAALFVESEEWQARTIHLLTEKPVFCSRSSRMFMGDGVEAGGLAERLARRSVGRIRTVLRSIW